MSTDIPGTMDQVSSGNFAKGCPASMGYPLVSIPSPSGSTMASPLVGNSHGLPNVVAGKKKELLDEVLEVRGKVERREYPHAFLEKYYPNSWGTYSRRLPEPLVIRGLSTGNPELCSDIVRMDNPLDLPIAILEVLLKQGAQPVSRETGHNDFLNRVPDATFVAAEKVKDALRKCFQIKYYYGEIRPEELVRANITAFPEGCPKHPSFPAGHGAAAGAGAKALIDHFILSNEQIKMVRDSAYLWSMFRTLAGVHYSLDNLGGLVVGGLLSQPEFLDISTRV